MRNMMITSNGDFVPYYEYENFLGGIADKLSVSNISGAKIVKGKPIRTNLVSPSFIRSSPETKDEILVELGQLKASRDKIIAKQRKAEISNKPMSLSGGHIVALNRVNLKIRQLENQLENISGGVTLEKALKPNRKNAPEIQKNSLNTSTTVVNESNGRFEQENSHSKILNVTEDLPTVPISNSLQSSLQSDIEKEKESQETKKSGVNYLGIMIAALILFLLFNLSK